MSNEWQPMATAPRDGTEIRAKYFDQSDDEADYIVWSERPVCMLGPVNGGFPPGWATGRSSDTDTNLPIDEYDLWRLDQ